MMSLSGYHSTGTPPVQQIETGRDQEGHSKLSDLSPDYHKDLSDTKDALYRLDACTLRR